MQQVPPCWYQPVRNTGLVWDAKTGLIEHKKEKRARVKVESFKTPPTMEAVCMACLFEQACSMSECSPTSVKARDLTL